MPIKNLMPVKAQADPCFRLNTTAKLVQYPGTFPEFIQWLKDSKFLMHDLEPYREHWNRGLFSYTTRKITATGKTVCVTRVTVRGLYVIKQRLKNQQKKQVHATQPTTPSHL